MTRVQLVYDTSALTPDLGQSYFHCAKCLEEMPKGVSPKEWSRQQAAITSMGIQVWCTRHDVNIASIEVRLAHE